MNQKVQMHEDKGLTNLNVILCPRQSNKEASSKLILLLGLDYTLDLLLYFCKYNQIFALVESNNLRIQAIFSALLSIMESQSQSKSAQLFE